MLIIMWCYVWYDEWNAITVWAIPRDVFNSIPSRDDFLVSERIFNLVILRLNFSSKAQSRYLRTSSFFRLLSLM